MVWLAHMAGAVPHSEPCFAHFTWWVFRKNHNSPKSGKSQISLHRAQSPTVGVYNQTPCFFSCFVLRDFCIHGHTVVCSQFQQGKIRKSFFVLEIACTSLVSGRRWWMCAQAPPAEQIFQLPDATLQGEGSWCLFYPILHTHFLFCYEL